MIASLATSQNWEKENTAAGTANGRAALTATQSVAGGCLLHKMVPGAETTGAKRQTNGRVV
jgi:hypothetical protein